MLVSLWEIGEGCDFFDFGLGGLVADQVVGGGVHIRCCGNGRLWFRPYGESLWQTPQRNQRSRPGVRPLAKARGSFAPVFIRGHCPPVCFATTYMQRVRLRRTALRATPRMNTSTQPPEGAGGSRSRAAGELTLGLMSGEKRRCTRTPVGARLAREDSLTANLILRITQTPCRSWLASEDGLPANLILQMYPKPCGSWLASDDGLPANLILQMYQKPVGAGLPAKTACLPT